MVSNGITNLFPNLPIKYKPKQDSALYTDILESTIRSREAFESMVKKVGNFEKLLSLHLYVEIKSIFNIVGKKWNF